MRRGSVSPGLLLLCSSKECENKKHEEKWMCCLAVTYGYTAKTGHIFIFFVAPTVTSGLETEHY